MSYIYNRAESEQIFLIILPIHQLEWLLIMDGWIDKAIGSASMDFRSNYRSNENPREGYQHS